VRRGKIASTSCSRARWQCGYTWITATKDLGTFSATWRPLPIYYWLSRSRGTATRQRPVEWGNSAAPRLSICRRCSGGKTWCTKLLIIWNRMIVQWYVLKTLEIPSRGNDLCVYLGRRRLCPDSMDCFSNCKTVVERVACGFSILFVKYRMHCLATIGNRRRGGNDWNHVELLLCIYCTR